MEPNNERNWSPYLAGALTGLLIIITTWITGIYFGASTSFVRAVAYIERLFSPQHVAATPYFQRIPPTIDWQFLFVIGILIGAFVAAITSRSFRAQAVPDMWQKRLGPDGAKRGLIAFAGGVIVMFGARMAGGCPSGFGLGALVQMGLSGLIAFICFFIGGIVVAQLLYRGGKGE